MIRPPLGCRNLVSRLNTVVLPAPFGPMSAWIDPRRTLRSTLRTALKPRKSLLSPSVSIIQSLTPTPSPKATGSFRSLAAASAWWKLLESPVLKQDCRGGQGMPRSQPFSRIGNIGMPAPAYGSETPLDGDALGAQRV